MANLSSIFVGGVTGDSRKVLRAIGEHLNRVHGVTSAHVPCTGQFTITKTLIEAGFKPGDIHNSDIGVFSSLLGYLYSGQRVGDLIKGGHLMITNDYVKECYEKETNDLGRVSLLLTFIKQAQLRKGIAYENGFRIEIEKYRDRYKDQLRKLLEQAMPIYEGTNYRIMDVREYFGGGENDAPKLVPGPSGLLMMNPPAYAKGYVKMFDVGEFMEWRSGIDEFDFGKEWLLMYGIAKGLETPTLWYTSQNIAEKIDKRDIVFTKEEGKGKYTYLLMPHRELVDDFPEKDGIMFKKSEPDIHKYEMLPEDAELTDEARVDMVLLNRDTALYYRSVLAHRLGGTEAEVYVGLFINGYLFSVAGFNTSFIRRMQDDYVFENFCFSTAHDKYENINRLSMLFLISDEFKNFLWKKVLNGSLYVSLRALRTTCLSRYRKVKLNNGILDLLKCEKEENGTYKLLYEKDYTGTLVVKNDKGKVIKTVPLITYKDCIRHYLADDAKTKAGWKMEDKLRAVARPVVSASGTKEQAIKAKPSPVKKPAGPSKKKGSMGADPKRASGAPVVRK